MERAEPQDFLRRNASSLARSPTRRCPGRGRSPAARRPRRGQAASGPRPHARRGPSSCPHGIRSLSKWHEEHPYVFDVDGQNYEVAYEPAESTTAACSAATPTGAARCGSRSTCSSSGAAAVYYQYYGDEFRVECPTGSGNEMTLFEVAEEISRAAGVDLHARRRGRRPVYGGTERFQTDPHWRPTTCCSTSTSTATTAPAWGRATRPDGPARGHAHPAHVVGPPAGQHHEVTGGRPGGNHRERPGSRVRTVLRRGVQAAFSVIVPPLQGRWARSCAMWRRQPRPTGGPRRRTAMVAIARPAPKLQRAWLAPAHRAPVCDGPLDHEITGQEGIRVTEPRMATYDAVQGPMPGTARSTASARWRSAPAPSCSSPAAIAAATDRNAARRDAGTASRSSARAGDGIGRREPVRQPADRVVDGLAEGCHQSSRERPGARHRHLLSEDGAHRQLRAVHVARHPSSRVRVHERTEQRVCGEHVGDRKGVGVQIEETAASSHRHRQVGQVGRAAACTTPPAASDDPVRCLRRCRREGHEPRSSWEIEHAAVGARRCVTSSTPGHRTHRQEGEQRCAGRTVDGQEGAR
jgi:hypothetical protein